MYEIFSYFFFILIPFCAYSQSIKSVPKRSFSAVKINSTIKIDGKDDELDWSKSTILTDFKQWRGDQVGGPSIAKTEVKVLYSDNAIYVFARNFDKREDVRKELSERDGIGNAGFFGFIFDPFLSEIDGFEFIVTTAGTQFDAKISSNGEDDNWDAVWDSKVIIGDEFWTVEIKIPYAALRFPTKSIQSWGANFFRKIQRNKERSSWNFIDTNQDGFVNQAGIMENLKDINAPLRLSATPFISVGIQTRPNGNQYSYGGGGDIKLGLNNAFTLDLTVIPDFSQTKTDEAILNISPFEVFYSERRPFFTEATDLFEKGDIIYTRRIGGQPLNYYNAYFSGNELEIHPDRNQLINAVKITGRTDKKLGIGFLNAVEARTYAVFKDGGKLLINPLTNFNVIVLDQQLKNNSSVSLINSNVFREGHDYDANVTALDYSLNTKNRVWGTRGVIAISNIIQSKTRNTLGHKIELSAGKQSGKLTYSMSYDEISDTYDPNDFGFQRVNNTREIYFSANYRENSPKKFRYYDANISFATERLYNPNEFIESWVNFNGNLTTKKFFSFGLGGFFRPVHGRDYNEPRTKGRFLKTPKVINVWYYVSTDYNKKLALDFHGSIGNATGGTKIGSIRLGLRYRISDQFTTRFNTNYNWNHLIRGYINKDLDAIGFGELNAEDIIIGWRNRNTIVSSLSISYKINNNMTCSFFGRNYWTQLETLSYGLLDNDGDLIQTVYTGINSNGEPLHNQTQDFFNIDFVYRWHFKPGSDLFLTWKNFAAGGDNALFSYGNTINKTFVGDKNNSITLKVLYYIDYNTLRK